MKTYETNTDFSFVMNIAKSFATVEHAGDTTTTTMYIKGVASSTRRDLQGERFSRKGLEELQKALEEGIETEDGMRVRVPLRSGHREEWEDVLGEIVKAEIDGDENLWITAQLDEDSSKAQELYRKLAKNKVKLGLSVRGKVTQYRLEWDDEIQKAAPIFDNIFIREVSVTQQPVNPSPYPLAIAKSLLADPNYETALEENMKDIKKSEQDEVLHPALANNNTEQKNIEGEEAQEQNQIAADVAQVGLVDTNVETVVEETTLDAPAAPAEPQRVAQVVAEDSNANDVPAGYAAPHSQSVTQEAQTQEVTTDSATADPVVKLSSSVDALLEQVQAMKTELEALKNKPVEAQKAIVAEPATLEVDLDTRIAVAVAKALESNTLTTELDAVKSLLTELAAQPQDRSISVSKAKDVEDENDPQVRFSQLKEKGFNPIRAAMGAAYDEK